jgi:hypothetical protein
VPLADVAALRLVNLWLARRSRVDRYHVDRWIAQRSVQVRLRDGTAITFRDVPEDQHDAILGALARLTGKQVEVSDAGVAPLA